MTKRLQSLVPLLLIGYFAYFAWGAMSAHFAMDDPVNLGRYWMRGFERTALDNVRFWSTAYRPMGGFVYLSTYYFFRLNPLPYRIVILGIVAANIGLTWLIAERLTGSKAAAALAAALVCSHAAMVTIYYNTSMIYDVLAYFFTAVMMAVYVRARGQGRELTRAEIAMVILTYIAALNSKEIAIVAAGWILAYEILLPRPRQWATALTLAAIGAVYSAGKLLGPNSLATDEGYRLEFTLHRSLVNNEKYWNSLLYSQYFQNSRRLLIVWGLLTIACVLYRKREVWWCWFLVSTATLPISFTVISREGGALYLPLLAWALLASVMITGLVRRPLLQWSLVALVAILWSHETIRQWRQTAPAYLRQQDLTWSVITQMRELPHPAPGSRVMILNSPFDGWDAYFISELLWNDRSIHIEMGDKSPAPPSADELKSFDVVLRFNRDELRVVRKP